MDPIKLSICIATYNRAEYIGETLESILPQLTDAVEVVIVDGASTDNTETVVRRYTERCGNVRYVRLPAKGGVDKDYDLAVEYAKGEYCWLFTDDDVFNPGAVQAVLDQLGNNYPLIIVNASVKDSTLDVLLEARKLDVSENIVYSPDDFERFFVNTADCMTFIGCVVIRRSIWQERERAKYYGTEFIHVGVVFQQPLPGPVLVVAEPYISIRLGNAQWTGRSFKIWMFQWPDLIWSFSDYSKASKQLVCHQNPWRRLHTLIYYRALGGYSLNEYNKLLSQRLDCAWKRIIARAIAVMPGRIANTFMMLYAGLGHNNQLIYNLQNSVFNARQHTGNER
ncbi:MAG: hypothetical protein A2X28_02070 [Elusimicrobia bacterium GWA2_56_46]|nr:MAG: hypothetical protein A2X28_02070 [Elusimicrobia bacterium GWA2_56_46]OGR55444.1 MAG: hypothetical protein A2X39_00895 [Elusimicrobia bacterium GWC2_56_31]HBW21910.1 glycosyltransferase family 2 protein [Elusimicrobiota bacterium]